MTNDGYLQSGVQGSSLYPSQMNQYVSGPVQFLMPKDKNMRKAVFTRAFWLSPPWGRPRDIDYTLLEEYEGNIVIRMIINHITDSIVQTEWDIVAEDKEKADDVPEEHIEEVREFFKSKTWNESWEETLRRMLPDLLLYDAGAIIKIFPKSVYDKDGVLKEQQGDDGKPTKITPVELSARDGRSFLKDTDLYGVTNRYFQYSWIAPNAKPIMFANEEIVYMMQRPQSRSPYGIANLEIIMDVVDYLTASIDAQRSYYENNFPISGQIDHPDIVDPDELLKRAQMYKETLKGESNTGKWLITSGGTKVTPLQISAQNMQWLESSEFFNKLVFAVFKINQSELGFTGDVNRATGVVQSQIYKAKGVQSVLRLLEEYINREIIWKHFHEDVMFQFDRSLDLADQKQQADIDHLELTDGTSTVNEVRARDGKEVYDDDEFNAPFAQMVMQQKIMMGGEEESEEEEGYGGWGGESEGGQPAEMPEEAETPGEEATPTTTEKIETLIKAVMADTPMGEPGAAFIPKVWDTETKKKKKKEEDKAEEDTVKSLEDWSETTQKQILNDVERLYKEK